MSQFYDPPTSFLKGTATITAGNTAVSVTHNFGSVPSLPWVAPLDEYGQQWYVSNIGAATFDINIPIAQGTDANFKYGVS